MLQVEGSGLPFTSQETNAVVVHLQKGLKVLVAVPRSDKDSVLSGIALSETSLTDDWLNPDKEEAWAHLRAPKTYTGKKGLALFSPVTSKIKGYPFEVKLPDGYCRDWRCPVRSQQGSKIGSHGSMLRWQGLAAPGCRG